MPEAGSPKPEATRLALWAPVVLYMALIFGLSSVSHPPGMPGGSDKVLHTLSYGVLGFLFARAVTRGRDAVTLRIVILTVCFGAAYGASDELHQYFNPPRTVEAADLVADTIGAGLGAAALYAWGIIRGRNAL